MNIEELLNLGNLIFERGAAAELQIERVEAYFSGFDSWLKENGGAVPATPADEPALQQLSDLHTRIMARAQTLLTSTSRELQNLSQRAKGIRAYVEVLPKRISVTGTRKG